MKVKQALLGAVVALGLSACATPYASSGLTGGYSEKQVDGAVWQVVFQGNGFTTPETVQTFWLYRCAELTLQKGYDGFEIVSDVHLVSNVHPVGADAVAIPVHGGGGGGGGGSHYTYIPVYIPNVAQPFMVAKIRMLKQPFTPIAPASFNAVALRMALEPHVKGKLCQGNVCAHPHVYLHPPAKDSST